LSRFLGTFARYFYGEMRRTHPWVFAGSLGGAAGGLLLMFVARALAH